MASTYKSFTIPALMKAMVLTGHGGIEKLEYRDNVPTPRAAPGEVLIKVGACGLNNTDINTRVGWYDRSVNSSVSEEVGRRGVSEPDLKEKDDRSASWNKAQLPFPFIQGGAVVGAVVAVGDGVSDERLGERVIVDPAIRNTSLPEFAQLIAYVGSERDGGFAEYVAVPQQNALAIRSSLADAELATFPCSYDTAEEMLERTKLTAGEAIVITGAAGGVGTALIQLSQIRGARQIIAIAGQAKKDRIRALGAHHFIPREARNVRELVEGLVGEQGVDVVADVVGGELFSDLLKMLRRGGRYSTAGAIGGPVQPFDLRDLIYKDLQMFGITSPPAATFQRVVKLIETGRLRPILEKTYPLAELGDAQAAMVKRSHFGKFVVTV